MCNHNAVKSAGTGTVREKSSSLGKLRNTCDTGIFLVEVGRYDFVFCSSNGWEDVWLALIVTVCADTLEEPSALPSNTLNGQSHLG